MRFPLTLSFLSMKSHCKVVLRILNLILSLGYEQPLSSLFFWTSNKKNHTQVFGKSLQLLLTQSRVSLKQHLQMQVVFFLQDIKLGSIETWEKHARSSKGHWHPSGGFLYSLAFLKRRLRVVLVLLVSLRLESWASFKWLPATLYSDSCVFFRRWWESLFMSFSHY